MVLQKKQQQLYPSNSINDFTLQVTEKQKYSGLVFDSWLSWDFQVSNVCKKMAYYLHLIKLHSKVFNNHITKLLIDSLVFSHLTYVLSVWGTSIKQQSVQRLVRFQNRAVSLLYKLWHMDHVTQYYRSTEWLSFPQLVVSIPLEPPIQFGHLSGYNTRIGNTFAHSLRYHFPSTLSDTI